MKKILQATVILISAFLAGCSGDGSDENPSSIVETDDLPKQKIHFYEDTVYINKSGGFSTAFLSYPSHEEIDVINQNSWITISPFANAFDFGITEMTSIGADKNAQDKERVGHIYFRYKDEPYNRRQELSDTLVVVQLATDSVLTNTQRQYFCDEHSSEIAIFTPYSDYYTSVKDNWIMETTAKRPNTPRCKFSFQIQELPQETDLRTTQINFSQPKDEKAISRTAVIEQRRAIIIKNKVNVMKVDTEHQLELDLSWAVSGQKMFYKSSDESVATISKDGRIKALTKGNTLITVESEDGKHISQMPLAVKTILSKDDNGVSIGMGIEISYGIRFFISISNGSDKEIQLNELTIKNYGEVIAHEENTLGTLAAGQNRTIYFSAGMTLYNMDCELKYTLNGEQFIIGEESGIVIQ